MEKKMETTISYIVGNIGGIYKGIMEKKMENYHIIIGSRI